MATKVTADTNVKLSQLYVVPGRNTRTVFRTEDMKELKSGVKNAGGLVEPLIVEPLTEVEIDGKKHSVYPILNGERRFRVLTELAEEGLTYPIPVHIKATKSEKEVVQVGLLANTGKPLDAVDMAFAVKRYIEELGGTRPEVCEMMGKTNAWISQRLRITELDKATLKALRAGTISIPDALALHSEQKHNAEKAKEQKETPKKKQPPTDEATHTDEETEENEEEWGEPGEPEAVPSAEELLDKKRQQKARQKELVRNTQQAEKATNVKLSAFEKEVVKFIGTHGLDGFLSSTQRAIDITIQLSTGREKKTWQNIAKHLEVLAGATDGLAA